MCRDSLTIQRASQNHSHGHEGKARKAMAVSKTKVKGRAVLVKDPPCRPRDLLGWLLTCGWLNGCSS
jgi:hypothetical protein